VHKSLFIACALFAGVISGCVTPLSPSEEARLNVFMVSWNDAREHRRAPRNTFAKGEMPTASVENLVWKTQQVRVEFIRVETGQIIHQTSFPVGRNEIRGVNAPASLPGGNYMVRVTAGNSPPIVQNFTIYGQ
jgi:hypothetical protein